MPFIGPVTNSSSSAGSIADDMYFADTAARDAFSVANPNRLFQGVTCAVGTTVYDYYQWNNVTKAWADANLIYQGKKGDKGDSGNPGGGFTLEQNKQIIMDLQSSIVMDPQSEIGIMVNGSLEPVVAFQLNQLEVGNDKIPLILRSNSHAITAHVGGSTKHLAFIEDTVKTIQAGTNITIDNTDPTAPIINSTGGGSSIDPSDGFVLKQNKKIVMDDDSSLLMTYQSRIDVDFQGFSEPIVAFDQNTMELGNNEFPLKIKTKANDIDVVVNGVDKHLALAEDTVNSIQAGTNITIDNTDPTSPIINSTGGGSGIDPSDGFVLKPDKDIELSPGSDILMDANSSIKFRDPNYAEAIIKVDAADLTIGNEAIGIKLFTGQDDIHALVNLKPKTVAFKEDVIVKLFAGSNITIDDTIPNAPIISATGGGSGIDPSDGFVLKPDKDIEMSAGSDLLLDPGSSIRHKSPQITESILEADSASITLGNNFTALHFRSESKDITAILDQTPKTIALKEDTVAKIIAGTNITVDNTNPMAPVVSATGGGTGKDPSEGFKLNPDKHIIMEQDSSIVMNYQSQISTTFQGIEEPVLSFESNSLELGSDTFPLRLKSVSDKIDVVVNGQDKHLAFAENTVKSIQPGLNILIDDADPTSPIISAVGHGPNGFINRGDTDFDKPFYQFLSDYAEQFYVTNVTIDAQMPQVFPGILMNYGLAGDNNNNRTVIYHSENYFYRNIAINGNWVGWEETSNPLIENVTNFDQNHYEITNDVVKRKKVINFKTDSGVATVTLSADPVKDLMLKIYIDEATDFPIILNSHKTSLRSDLYMLKGSSWYIFGDGDKWLVKNIDLGFVTIYRIAAHELTLQDNKPQLLRALHDKFGEINATDADAIIFTNATYDFYLPLSAVFYHGTVKTYAGDTYVDADNNVLINTGTQWSDTTAIYNTAGRLNNPEFHDIPMRSIIKNLKFEHSKYGEMRASDGDLFVFKYKEYVYSLPLCYIKHSNKSFISAAGKISYDRKLKNYEFDGTNVDTNVKWIGCTNGSETQPSVVIVPNNTSTNKFVMQGDHPVLGKLSAGTNDYFCYIKTYPSGYTFIYTIDLSIVKTFRSYSFKLGEIVYIPDDDEFQITITDPTSAEEVFFTIGNFDLRATETSLSTSAFKINTNAYFFNDLDYEVLTRQYPVTATTPIKKGQLISMVTDGDYNQNYPSVEAVTSGSQYGTGIANNDAEIGDVVISLTSGVFEFDPLVSTMEGHDGSELPLHQRIYVNPFSGMLTKEDTGYVIGWILNGNNALLDIDLYNSRVSDQAHKQQQSLRLGPQTLFSVGETVGINTPSRGDSSVIVSQSMQDGVLSRPTAYMPTDTTPALYETTVHANEAITKEKETLFNVVPDGFYVIQNNSLEFLFPDYVERFVVRLFNDDDETIWQGEYHGENRDTYLYINNPSLLISSATTVYVSVKGENNEFLPVMGQFGVQKFSFKYLPVDQRSLAFDGEGGGGTGDYPLNPEFENVTLNTIQNDSQSTLINMVGGELNLVNHNDNGYLTLEANNIAMRGDTFDFRFDQIGVDIDNKRLTNVGNATDDQDAVNLQQAKSMLVTSILPLMNITLNDSYLYLTEEMLQHNLFFHGGGLDSHFVMDAERLASTNGVIQLTMAEDFALPVVPVLVKSQHQNEKYLLSFSATFALYDGFWQIVSDARPTFVDTSNLPARLRRDYHTVTVIKAGDGLVSTIDDLGTLRLDVVGGGQDIHFDFPDGTLVMAENELPADSGLRQELGRLVVDRGMMLDGHLLDSGGEVLMRNNNALVEQPIDPYQGYSNPLIFKEELGQHTYLTTSFVSDGIVKPLGQELRVINEDYAHVRMHANTLHFRMAKNGEGYRFRLLDHHENEIFTYISELPYSSGSTQTLSHPTLTLHANQTYLAQVYSLSGEALALLGGGDVQMFSFDYQDLSQHALLTDIDSTLPDDATFEHVRALRVSDPSNTVGLELNSAGMIESDAQIVMNEHPILHVGDAIEPHGVPSLSQVRGLINNAEFVANIDIDGQPVEALQLDEETFGTSYNPITKVMNLTVKGGGNNPNADGTVNPVVTEEMSGYLVEFATEDGKLIRTSHMTAQSILDEHERIWDKLDPAYKTAITAQTEAASNTVAIAHINKRTIPELERKVTHNRIVNTGQDVRLDRIDVELKLHKDSIDNVGRRCLALEEGAKEQAEATAKNTTDLANNTETLATVENSLESTISEVNILKEDVLALEAYPLEKIAAGQYQDRVSVTDSYTSAVSNHYMTPAGSEIEYVGDANTRSNAPDYTFAVSVDGQRKEALKLGLESIKAMSLPIKELANGVDPQDAVTIGQMTEKLDDIFEKIQAIEDYIGMTHPVPEVFPVYAGRLSIVPNTDAEIFKAMNTYEDIRAATLLNNDGLGYDIGPSFPLYTYAVIAYPKGVLDPDPKTVIYDGFMPATRESYEMVINGIMYVVLYPEWPDQADGTTNFVLMQ